MAFAKVRKFEMDRRSLLRLTGSMGIGAMFITPEQLFAQDADLCLELKIDSGNVEANQAGAVVQYWIDGLHLGERSDIKSRANLALFMNLEQTEDVFVESVVLMDENNRTLGARYFDSSMKMNPSYAKGNETPKEYLPYVIFENIELDRTKDYRVVYVSRVGSKAELYSALIEKPTLSRLNETWLPKKIRDDFRIFLNGDASLNTDQNKTPGLITTPFQYYTENGLENHCARGRFTALGSDGGFTCNIDFMHGDGGPSHYMRYFVVMDPVGRLLGFVKREFGDSRSGALDVRELATSGLIAEYNISSLQVADIRDCPYVQIYTEDSFDALARATIRLR